MTSVPLDRLMKLFQLSRFRSQVSRRTATITEDLTLFRCQQEHARREREERGKRLRRPGALIIRLVGKETHILA